MHISFHVENNAYSVKLNCIQFQTAAVKKHAALALRNEQKQVQTRMASNDHNDCYLKTIFKDYFRLFKVL